MLISPDSLRDASNAFLTEKADIYLNELAKIANKEAAFIIDCMPDNYLYLGLINILFPDSMIIHCTRHPMDLCLANYFHYYGDQHPYTHHLVTIGKYYLQYAKLMSYWQSIGIENRIEVKYEDLVQNTDIILQQLYEDLNLSATESHTHPRIFQNEVDRWKLYQHYLQPLTEVLYNA